MPRNGWAKRLEGSCATRSPPNKEANAGAREWIDVHGAVAGVDDPKKPDRAVGAEKTGTDELFVYGHVCRLLPAGKAESRDQWLSLSSRIYCVADAVSTSAADQNFFHNTPGREFNLPGDSPVSLPEEAMLLS